eukprot:9865906-Ditylum_brightwellii.AAC.2
MENNLLCTMQLRMDEIVVNDKPKFLTHKPTENDHCICIPDSGEILRIPSEIKSVTSYVSARKPLQSEYDDDNSTRFELTLENPEWDPNSTDFAQLEQRYFDGLGRFKEVGDKERRRVYSISQNSLIFKLESHANQPSQSDVVLAEISPTMIEGNFTKSLRDNVNANDVIDTDVRQTSAMSGKRTYLVTPEGLVIR